MTAGQPEPEIEVDASPVEDVLRLVERCMRAIQLYLPNNPVYAQAVENLRKGFAGFWGDMEELILRVTKNGFEWEGVAIHPERDKSDSIGWTLYKDGVRQLVFKPGAEEEEVIQFLTVVNAVRALPADADDDLLTLLWEKEFELIQYVFIELGTEDMPALEPSGDIGTTAPEDVQTQIQQDATTTEDEDPGFEHPPALANVDDFDSTLYFLEESEIRHIKEDLEREYSLNLRTNVLAMLFDIMQLQTFNDPQIEVVEILGNVLPNILGSGDFQAVAYLLKESRVVLEGMPTLNADSKKKLEDLPSRLSQPEVLAQILQALDEAHVRPTEDELEQLFKVLHPSTLRTLLEWLPRLHNTQVRELVEQSVDPIAQYHPQAVADALNAKDHIIVTGALRLVTRHKLQNVANRLATFVKHDDAEVRVLVVDAFKAISTPTALQHLRDMIDDGDRDVRISAVKALMDKKNGPAFEKIESYVKGNKLRNADLSERRAFYEAYGVLGGERGVAYLSEILSGGKGLLKRKAEPEIRALAAMALGKVGSAAARASLESVGRDKEPLVRNAVIQALRESR